MASWHTSPGSKVEWTRCPTHHALAVRDLRCRWIWRCAECLRDAALATDAILRKNGR